MQQTTHEALKERIRVHFETLNLKQRKEKYFKWSDAWIFISFRGALDKAGKVNFVDVVRIGDSLNHALMLKEEIREALVKLHQRGLVKVTGSEVFATELVYPLFERIGRMRGGWFTVVDNTLKVLNSPRTILPFIDVAPNVRFVNQRFVHRADREYLTDGKSPQELLKMAEVTEKPPDGPRTYGVVPEEATSLGRRIASSGGETGESLENE